MATEPDSDPDLDKALLERASEAAKRWRDREPIREERNNAIKDGRPFDADSRPRLALRLNRLINEVRSSSRDRRPPDNPTLRELIARPTPLAPEDLNAELVQEVVLGVRNFLSVEFLARGIQSARPVGRILIQSGGSVRARGTGFLVARGMVLTNEHVLRSKEQAAACSIQMDYELNRFGPNPQPQSFPLEPGRFFLNNPKFDFALVAVAPRSAQGALIDNYGWLTLNDAQGKISINLNDYVNIIQHPLGREKEIVVRDNRLLDLEINNQEPVPLGPFLHYEADTEKGSSGSPVLNDQWEVVALHHTGVPVEDEQGRWLDKEGQVWDKNTQSPTEIAWRANEGVRVSSLIAEFSRASVRPEEKPLLDQVLAKQPPPVVRPVPNVPDEAIDKTAPDVERPPRRRPEPAPEPVKPPDDVRHPAGAEFEIPIRISITVGAQRPSNGASHGIQAKAAAISERFRSELLEEALSSEDYADRDGYDRRFLGINVPFPTMKARPQSGGVLDVPRPARPRDRNELRYHRFSVIMNKKRRLAYVSACNVNFNPPASVTRDEGSQSWRRDPRIDPEHQLGAPYYDHNEYDKGHLTRRDDAAWGRDQEDALASNWDTFHYTNAAPQQELFNRSDDFTGAKLDLWGDLENFISEQGSEQRTRLTIFNGPIFTARDKKLDDALVPWSFFKIVIWRDKNQPPGALGFVLDQRDLIKDLPEEAIDPGRFSVRQKRISSIERDLDISFGPVTEWDQMPAIDPHEALDEDGVEISSFADIAIANGRAKPKSSKK
jgi:endonuclease G